jgi:chromosome segregation ATPase
VRIEVKATNERLDATNRRLDVVAERVDLVAERVELVGERVDVLSTTLLGFTAEQRSVTRDLEKRVSKLESAVPGSK